MVQKGSLPQKGWIRWIKWSKCTRWFLMIQKITDPSFLDLVVLAAELPRRHRDWCCHLAALAACTSKKQHRERDHSPKTRGFYQNGFRIKGSTGLMDLRKLGYDFYHLNIHNNSRVGCCFVSFFFFKKKRKSNTYVVPSWKDPIHHKLRIMMNAK